MKNIDLFRGLKVLSAVLVLTLINACASKPEIILPCTIPAKTSVNIRTLALANFKGEQGQMLRNRLYGKLADSKYFTLVDRNQTAIDIAIGQEIQLDPRYLEELKDVHADGILVGSVRSEFKDTKGTDRDSKGKSYPYTIRNALLLAEFQVFDLEKGMLIAAGSVKSPFDKKYGGCKTVGPISICGIVPSEHLPIKSETANKLVDEAAQQIAQKIAPMETTCTFTLAEGDKNPLIERGNEFAKRGVLDSAKELWEEALQKDPSNPAACHNLGVYHETLGDLKNLEKAEKFFKNATRLSTDTFYIDSVGRIQKAIGDEKIRIKDGLKRRKERIAGQTDVY
jgi:tetratricopeptide (TPR) repeat protein